VLKLVAFVSDVYPDNVVPHMFIDKVNTKSKGELIVDWIGGQEAIPPPDLPPAVQRGSVDMAHSLDSMANPLAPGVSCIMHSEVTVEEFRKGGGLDLAREIFMKSGIFYLGVSAPAKPQTSTAFFTNKKVEKLEDFVGLKLGIPSPTFLPFVEALKATPVVMSMGDFFTAMERGTVDGYNMGMPGVESRGLIEVTKYMIDETYGSWGTCFLVNLEKWNKLPKHLQDVLIEATIETETEGVPLWSQIEAELKQKLVQGGVEIIKLPPDDSKRFHDLYKEATWKVLFEKYPDIAPKFKELIAP
jgi:TRAP-type mannitol/chloroaromatic compound transport system substrate-binding protein